jgi:hypothetical protein
MKIKEIIMAKWRKRPSMAAGNEEKSEGNESAENRNGRGKKI